MKNLFLLLLVALFVSNCASTYKPFNPKYFEYNSLKGEDVSYAYKNDVMAYTGNRKYAKKATKHDIDIVAIKLQNNTNKAIVVKDDIKFMIDNREIVPLETYVIEDKIKQQPAWYALYGLLFLTVDTPTAQGVYPIGVPIGIGNIIVASTSNSNFKKNYYQENIMTKTIEPGETIHGIVAFRDLNYNVLSVEIN